MIAALRRLFRRPGFAVSVTAILALATSASTALLSVVEAALLRPVPWKDPAHLAT